jgi:murein DD-endopeptidase MepM/ murein hydrolase activator NlpD
VPISESDNPDAIALRSAISLLQLQREKSKRDLKTLEELKAVAVSDPQGFVRSIQAQRIQPSKTNNDPLSPTLADVSGSLLDSTFGAENEQRNGDERKDSVDGESGADSSTKFPTIPQPQNIIRCPPVNWAKYHIVGESLDKMHKEQRQYPGSVEPPRNQQGAKAPPHAVSAPYSPFTDSVGDSQSAQPWRGLKKSPS